MTPSKTQVVFVFIALLIVCCSRCGDKVLKDVPEQLLYLNHHDTVKYVGMKTCMQCHSDKHATYIHTGMGMSFDSASKRKSAADFGSHPPVYDKYRDLYYHPFWSGEHLYIKEYRLSGKDTVHSLLEEVDYIVGSGQHTNSHIVDINGYLYQAPLTWYAQKKKWDMPPGFEQGNNSRFTRLIGYECMTCHNGLPGFVKNSENRFTNIPDGIDCERCHGPGEIHVKEMLAGNVKDLSKEIDRTIVNPSKLPWELQIDVCQRCHLQGNAVLKEGKDFDDFRPGMSLTKVMDVFMPRYLKGDGRFIMASHAQRLQMSPCFIHSNSIEEKESGHMDFTCITCHNPHVSVKETGTKTFNDACLKCHKQEHCTESPERLKKFDFNCVQCHMPVSGTEDIPHVTVHDHFIRKPEPDKGIISDEAREFIGLYAINNANPDALTKARAYLQQYERFERNKTHLDSAIYYIRLSGGRPKELIHYYYLREDFQQVISEALRLKKDDDDPWTFTGLRERIRKKAI